MVRRTLILYKTSTGFTKRYAKILAEKLNGSAVDIKNARSVSISLFDTVIFGTRAHAGTIDGLKKFRRIFRLQTGNHFSSAALHSTPDKKHPLCILFVTGAAPETEKDMINRLWEDNLTEEERTALPHFYMPAGLCYEKMNLPDRILMKGLSVMMKRKKDKTAKDMELAQRISASFDISSEKYVYPLLDYISGTSQVK